MAFIQLKLSCLKRSKEKFPEWKPALSGKVVFILAKHYPVYRDLACQQARSRYTGKLFVSYECQWNFSYYFHNKARSRLYTCRNVFSLTEITFPHMNKPRGGKFAAKTLGESPGPRENNTRGSLENINRSRLKHFYNFNLIELKQRSNDYLWNKTFCRNHCGLKGKSHFYAKTYSAKSGDRRAKLFWIFFPVFIITHFFRNGLFLQPMNTKKLA